MALRPEDEDLLPDWNARAMRCKACHATASAASARAGQDEPDPNAGMYWFPERGD